MKNTVFTVDIAKELIVSKVNEIAGVDTGKLFDIGLIPANHARNWIVKQKYFEMAKTGRTYTDIKLELSVEYGVSVSTIEKLVYRK
jgi:hypothetical protein